MTACAGDLADHERGVAVAVRGLVGDGDLLGRHVVGRDRGAEMDVRAATTTTAVDGVPPPPPVLLLLFSIRMISTNATTARKIPMSRTNRFERFNESSPRTV